jgi:hypothetical protein
MGKAGKTILWIAGILAGLIVVAVIALYVIVSTYDFNNLKPRIEKAALEATGRQLVLGGDINLDIGLSPSLVVEDIRFANAEWGSRNNMATVERFEVQVALIPLISGDIEIKRLVAVRPDILVEKGSNGQSNLAMKPAKETRPEKPAQPEEAGGGLPVLTVYDLRVQDANLTYRDQQTGQSASLKLARFEAQSTSGQSPIQLDLEANVNDIDVSLAGSLGSIKALTDPSVAWPIDVTLRGPGGSVDLEGEIQDPMTPKGIALALAAEVTDPGKLNQALGREVPLQKPLTVKARASDPQAKVYALKDLEVVHGQSDLKGSCTVGLAGSRPSVALDLTSDTIDLAWLQKTGGSKPKGDKAAKAEPAQSDRNRVFPAEPLPVEALKSVDAAVTFQAGEVILPSTTVQDLQLKLELKNGNLTVSPMQAAVGGGTLKGQVQARTVTSGLKTALTMNADKVDLGSLIGEIKGKSRFTGQMKTDIELQGQGGSVAGIMAGLDGKVKLAVSNGTVDNQYLNLLGSDLRAGMFRLLNPVKEKTDQVRVNCLITMLDINSGLADIAVMVFDTPVMTVRGDGDINLQTEALNVALAPKPKEGLSTGVAGKLSFSLGELTKNFKLGGTLANPKLALDPTQTVTTIAEGLGGAALFGPAGLAGALATGGEEEQDPCLSALEALEGKQAPASSSKQDSSTSKKEGSPVEQGSKAIEEGVKGLQDSIKGLFN